jgi:hypothetical protein
MRANENEKQIAPELQLHCGPASTELAVVFF